jgi:hypothetical protein
VEPPPRAVGYPALVKIFTKRNALIGYLALRAASGRRVPLAGKRRSRRSAWKLGMYLALGVVSVGVLLALAVVLRHKREPQHLEGHAVADEVAAEPAAATVLEPDSPAAA